MCVCRPRAGTPGHKPSLHDGAGTPTVVAQAKKPPRMTPRAQARRSAAMLTSYGSNTANAVFMRPGARLVVCWPNPDARRFWPGRGRCILHAAALALGVLVQVVPRTSSSRRVGRVLRGPFLEFFCARAVPPATAATPFVPRTCGSKCGSAATMRMCSLRPRQRARVRAHAR